MCDSEVHASSEFAVGESREIHLQKTLTPDEAVEKIRKNFHTSSIEYDGEWTLQKTLINFCIREQQGYQADADEVIPLSRRNTRLTINYGWNSFRSDDEKRHYIKPPEWLVKLGNRVKGKFADKVPEDAKIDNYIISIYGKGDGLKPHFDFAKNNEPFEKQYPCNQSRGGFYYEDCIFGLIVKADKKGGKTADKSGKLYWMYDNSGEHPKDDATKLFECEESPGMVYFFNGEIRNFPFFHGVSPVGEERISITFRSTGFYS